MNPTTIRVFVPILAPDLDELAANDLKLADRMRTLFHQIMLARQKVVFNPKKYKSDLFKLGWAPISTELLKKLFSNNYPGILKTMEENQLIERRNDDITGRVKYTAAKYCGLMRINNRLLNKNGLKHYRIEEVSAKVVVNAIQNTSKFYKQESQLEAWYQLVQQHHQQLAETTKRIRFDMNRVEEFLQQEADTTTDYNRKRYLRECLMLTAVLHEGLLDHYTIDSFGERLHTSLTSLYGKLKQFMYIENVNEPLVSIDIKNSQPYLLSTILYNPSIITHMLPEFVYVQKEIEKYKDSVQIKAFHYACAEGNLYEQFMPHLKEVYTGDDKTLRDFTKEKLIGFLYAKPNGHIPHSIEQKKKKDFNSVFHLLYADVESGMCKIKTTKSSELPFMDQFYTDKNNKYVGDKASYKNLSAMMQRLESRIVLGKIAPQLLVANIDPILTIHDSFIVPARHESLCRMIIENEFKNLNVRPPQLKTETVGIPGVV